MESAGENLDLVGVRAERVRENLNLVGVCGAREGKFNFNGGVWSVLEKI